MGIRLSTVHKYICVTLWCIWFLGIVITALSFLLQFLNDELSHKIFFLIVHPYNKVVLVCSLFPVEPVMLIASVIQDIHLDGITKAVGKPIMYFAVTVIIWLIYIGSYISLSGI